MKIYILMKTVLYVEAIGDMIIEIWIKIRYLLIYEVLKIRIKKNSVSGSIFKANI